MSYGEWISVAERLPDDGVPVLVAGEGMMTVACLVGSSPVVVPDYNGWSAEGISVGDDGQLLFTPTHWQLLPEPPKEG